MKTNISSDKSQQEQATNVYEGKPKGIVLNRMYTGSYLSTNLGHEVINMFQADNDKHYLYLNARGNFSNNGKQVNTMLLVRHIGGSTVEVVGMAKNLNAIESAHCSLPRDIGIIDKDRQNQQVGENGLGIKYRGIPIENIFGSEGQQNIYASYWVENSDFYTPRERKRLIIKLTKEKTKQPIIPQTDDIIKIELRSNFGSTSLHQYIIDESDLAQLNEVCDIKNNEFWEPGSKKVEIPKDLKEDKVSLFDICQIQKDENRISNALSYFIDKYPKLWQNFFAEQLKNIEELKNFELDEIKSVTREEDAKVEGMENTGGRIDLLIRTKNCYIILENKIDSEIIIENNVTQLERYYNYVSFLQTQEIDRLEKKITPLDNDLNKYKGYYEDPNKKHWKNRSKWEQKINELTLKVSKMKQEWEDVKNRKIEGFVLTPNYNPPKDNNLLKVKNRDFSFKWLSYKTIYDWLTINKDAQYTIEKDANFNAFYNVIKRHTYEFESSMLYEEMKAAFFTRIKELNHTSISTK